MQSPKNSNLKIYIFIAICMVVIIGMWLYTLKLNLSKPSKSTFDWSEIFGGWGDAVKDVPPMPQLNTTTPEVSDELINELADKLKDVTKDWEVYIDEELGFEIKYPNEGVEIILDDVIERGTIGSPSFKFVDGGHFALGVYDNENNFTPREWLDNEYMSYSSGWYGEYNDEIINGLSVVRAIADERNFKTVSSQGCYIEWVIFQKDNKFYTIAGEFCDVNQNIIEVFNQTVSTFKFIYIE